MLASMEVKHMFYILAFLFLIVFQHGSVYSTASPASFARTNGSHFVVNDRSFYSNGFNSYWLMYMAADPAERLKVSSTLQEASNLGLNVIRTWAFSDGGDRALQYSPGSYNEEMFKALDFVVSEAKKYGVYLILTLVNNWDGYGGKKQYVQWARDKGQYLNSEDDFFRNDVIKGYYKDHTKAILTRVNTISGLAYKDDPTIFAWELINEPRCQSDLSGKTLQAWITEMAAHVKSIDSNHMLEIGLEGFYGDSVPERKQYNSGYEVGTDFISNNQVREIDFSTIHAYPDQWVSGSNDDSQLAFVNRWIDSHVQDAGKVLGKPLMLTEFGKSSKESGYAVAKRDAYYSAVFDAIYASASTGGACVGGLFWQVMAPGMENFDDGYEVVFASSPSTTAVISQQGRRMRNVVVPLSR